MKELIFKEGQELMILNPERSDKFHSVVNYGIVPGTGIIQIAMGSGAEFQFSFFDGEIPFDPTKMDSIRIEFEGIVTIRINI
ncbi:hypothetical protein DNU06_07915 [Putridiphycobacter roseus]|uniref:Uncharacterized protein n=1 Tax=Putridiphycobacter roseus TaxID=2219161 RepID=A0A2W1N0X8_9FLAO|nr:hypothetical protein [Putridiphycobacter roseus]PZE17190.1 hypothetical protein DNU06_07915 [Putridiphycobacter roseus]